MNNIKGLIFREVMVSGVLLEDFLVPIVQKHALPAINSGLQEIGKTAL